VTVHVTVSPAAMDTVSGSNAKSTIETAESAPRLDGGAAASSTAAEAQAVRMTVARLRTAAEGVAWRDTLGGDTSPTGIPDPTERDSRGTALGRDPGDASDRIGRQEAV
jgi:hypothetical protein